MTRNRSWNGSKRRCLRCAVVVLCGFFCVCGPLSLAAFASEYDLDSVFGPGFSEQVERDRAELYEDLETVTDAPAPSTEGDGAASDVSGDEFSDVSTASIFPEYSEDATVSYSYASSSSYAFDFGRTSSSFVESYDSYSKSLVPASSYEIRLSDVGDGEITGSAAYLKVYEGTTFTLVSERDFSDCVVTISGSVSWGYWGGISRDDDDDFLSDMIYSGSFDTVSSASVCYLLVNGQQYGDPLTDYTGSSCTYQIDTSEIGDITSLGWQIFFNESVSQKITFDGSSYFSYGFFVFEDDTVSVKASSASDGFLASIIEWLRSIKDAIINLPGTIADYIIDGIKSLFVPDEEFATEYKTSMEQLLSDKLGFIYESYVLVGDTVEAIGNGMNGTEYQFTFPGISVPMSGETYEIVAEQSVSLENGLMDVVRPVLGTIVMMVSGLGFFRVCVSMFESLISGQSWAAWMHRRSVEEGSDDAD